MFSVLKRLISNQNDNKSTVDDLFNQPNEKGSSRIGVQPISYQLQKEFSKGIQYNMKIIIKGDRNVGKTCLFKRLQGLAFRENYVPTEEIQVANIHWNYKATDDVVKVEVWDVVDKGKKWSQINGLKIDNKPKSESKLKEEECSNQLALDAEFIDVYKATNGVIMMLDITKTWTFDYIQRELPKVPLNIPALVLANHRDMGHHRVITEDQVKTFIESLGRDKGPGQIRYAESSMRNGFGLKFLHKFFNIPFLHLQQESLKKQLETNKNEIETTYEELDILQESDEQSYDKFIEMLTNKRRTMADKLSKVSQPSIGDHRPTPSISMQVDLAKNKVSNLPVILENIKPNPSIVIGATKSFVTKSNISWFQNYSNNETQSEIETDEDQIRYRSFLTESTVEAHDEESFKIEEEKEDSEDEKTANPMVSGYQEELDPEDKLSQTSDLAVSESVNINSSFKASSYIQKESFNNHQKSSVVEPVFKSNEFEKKPVEKNSQNLFQVFEKTQFKAHQIYNPGDDFLVSKELKSEKKKKEKGKKKYKKEDREKRKQKKDESQESRKFEKILEPSFDLISKRELNDYESL